MDTSGRDVVSPGARFVLSFHIPSAGGASAAAAADADPAARRLLIQDTPIKMTTIADAPNADAIIEIFVVLDVFPRDSLLCSILGVLFPSMIRYSQCGPSKPSGQLQPSSLQKRKNDTLVQSDRYCYIASLKCPQTYPSVTTHKPPLVQKPRCPGAGGAKLSSHS